MENNTTGGENLKPYEKPALFKIEFRLYLWQAEEETKPYGIIPFPDLKAAELFVISMLEGTFEKAPTIGINEVWISTETGQPVKEIIKRVVRLGNDETEAQVISEADEIVYDDLSPDSNLHQVRPIEVSAKPKPIRFYSSRNRGHKL